MWEGGRGNATEPTDEEQTWGHLESWHLCSGLRMCEDQRRGEEGGVTIGGLALDYELNPHGSVRRVTNKIRIVLKSCVFFILDPVSLNPTLR